MHRLARGQPIAYRGSFERPRPPSARGWIDVAGGDALARLRAAAIRQATIDAALGAPASTEEWLPVWSYRDEELESRERYRFFHMQTADGASQISALRYVPALRDEALGALAPIGAELLTPASEALLQRAYVNPAYEAMLSRLIVSALQGRAAARAMVSYTFSDNCQACRDGFAAARTPLSVVCANGQCHFDPASGTWPNGQAPAQIQALHDALAFTLMGFSQYLDRDFYANQGPSPKDDSHPWKTKSDNIIGDAYWQTLPKLPPSDPSDAAPPLAENIRWTVNDLNLALFQAEEHQGGYDAMDPFLNDMDARLVVGLDKLPPHTAPPPQKPPPTTPTPSSSSGSSSSGKTIAVVAGVAALALGGTWLALGKPMTLAAVKSAARGVFPSKKHHDFDFDDDDDEDLDDE